MRQADAKPICARSCTRVLLQLDRVRQGDFSAFRPWMLPAVANIALMAREGGRMSNPLDWRYYSTTPYRLGNATNLAVKCVPYTTSFCPSHSDS